MKGTFGRTLAGLVAVAAIFVILNAGLAQTPRVDTPHIRIKPPTIKPPTIKPNSTPIPGAKSGLGTANPGVVGVGRGTTSGGKSGLGTTNPGAVGVGRGTSTTSDGKSGLGTTNPGVVGVGRGTTLRGTPTSGTTGPGPVGVGVGTEQGRYPPMVPAYTGGGSLSLILHDPCLSPNGCTCPDGNNVEQGGMCLSFQLAQACAASGGLISGQTCVCSSGMTLVNGSCVSACPTGSTFTDGACVCNSSAGCTCSGGGAANLGGYCPPSGASWPIVCIGGTVAYGQCNCPIINGQGALPENGICTAGAPVPPPQSCTGYTNESQCLCANGNVNPPGGNCIVSPATAIVCIGGTVNNGECQCAPGETPQNSICAGPPLPTQTCLGGTIDSGYCSCPTGTSLSSGVCECVTPGGCTCAGGAFSTVMGSYCDVQPKISCTGGSSLNGECICPNGNVNPTGGNCAASPPICIGGTFDASGNCHCPDGVTFFGGAGGTCP